ncbi:FAD binding domain-containing protein [Tardiphaga alba]|uniref:FAD binding domain-containing protein n=1 Tax=Tardiphaga alba TaxID=340268 RepID=UPI0038B5BA9A
MSRDWSGGETSAGHRRYNCVWYRRNSNLQSLLIDRDGQHHSFSLAPGQVPDTIRYRLIDDANRLLPPAFADVISAEPRPFVQGIFDMSSSRMVRGSIALLGDAAFVVRPHTAMGVSKAAGDAMALVRALGALGKPDALEIYDRERKHAGRLISEFGRRLGAVLAP